MMELTLQQNRTNLAAQETKLRLNSPLKNIKSFKIQQTFIQQRMQSAITHQLDRLEQKLFQTSQTLNAFSPLATLNRGYALIMHPETGSIIRSIEELSEGDLIKTRFSDGQVISQVQRKLTD